jgi:hypothetical protein
MANPDTYTVAENTTNTFFVTTNDVMNGGSTPAISSVNATNGIATIVNGTNIMFRADERAGDRGRWVRR